MAYDKEKVFKDVIKAIKNNKLKHFNHIGNFIEPDIKTIKEWGWQSGECTECTTIKKELAFNKVSSKIKLINKWEDSDNPTLQIAAFKLIADESELQALSTNWQKNEHSGEIKTNDVSKLTTEELISRANAVKKIDE